MSTDHSQTRRLDLSVLIATRDRAQSLARTLAELVTQRPAGINYEVVVVDNGSSDATPTVLAEATERLPLVVASEPSRGKNRALNRALGLARGSLLVFTDDDVMPAPRWLEELHQAAGRWPEDNVFGGTVKPAFPERTPDWLTAESFPYGRWAFGEYAPRPDEGPTSDTPLGSNLALRSRVLDGLTFDERMGPGENDYPMGSEVELLLRLYRRGEQFIYVPTAQVRHMLTDHSVTMTCLSGRAYRCGRGNARLFPDAGSFPLLGFPLYSAKRALATLAGMAVAPLRGEADRCLHLLTLSQLRGEWAERRRMVAERVAGARRFPAWKAVSQVLERRGLLGTLLIPVRWLLSPLARWEQLQFFEWRSQEPPLELPRLDGVDFAVFHGTDQSRSARVALCPLERLKPEEIDQRLQNGDSVVVAWLGGRAVGYAWNTYSDLHVPEIGAVVRLDPLEALGYDGYVSNEFRGMGVLPHLDRWLMKDMVQRGRKRQLIYADTRNRAILRSLKRAGKRKVFRVWRLRVPWLGLDTGPRSSEASVSCHDAMSKKLGRAAS